MIYSRYIHKTAVLIRSIGRINNILMFSFAFVKCINNMVEQVNLKCIEITHIINMLYIIYVLLLYSTLRTSLAIEL